MDIAIQLATVALWENFGMGKIDQFVKYVEFYLPIISLESVSTSYSLYM